MKPIITGFKNSPDKGKGLARDFRIRWALEELGQKYETRLLSFTELKEENHRKLNPFGQIPTYEDGEVSLFESGAIILHIAQKYNGLLPKDLNKRAKATAWIFASLNTIEPPVWEFTMSDYFDRNKPWKNERKECLEKDLNIRLQELSNYLGSKLWLENEFSAGDLLMVTVLRRLYGHEIIENYKNLYDYTKRAEGREAFKKAFADQLAVFKKFA